MVYKTMVFSVFNNFPLITESISNNQILSLPNSTVISFFYQLGNHDFYPVIISTGPMTNRRIGGLNLHYLTFPVFRALLNNWAGNQMFNYLIIKNQPVIKNAFRSYKINGMKNVKKVNYKAIIEVMSIKRNYSPQEMLVIQQAVDKYVLSRQPEILNELFGNMMAKSVQQSTQQTIQSQQTVGTEIAEI